MATYTVNLSVKGMKDLKNYFEKIRKLLTGKRIYNYIAKKCMEELNQITLERLSSTDTKKDVNESYYASRHQYRIEGDTIYIFNDSTIDIASKNMSETTKAKYPAQLSLAKIVEYGIGYTGANFTVVPEGSELPSDDWKYDVNNHGYRGWYYTDENGEVVWTNGYEGKLIFHELVIRIKKNASTWIKDYIEKNIK